MTVVLPGDVVPFASSSSIKLGPGLLPTPAPASTSLTAIRPGALGQIEPSTSSIAKKKDNEAAFWVETNTSRVRTSHPPHPSHSIAAPYTNPYPSFPLSHCVRCLEQYVPAPSDPVIAQITNRGAEAYTVTLFSAHAATLPALSFEGATKRHKPNLRIGALVYARIVSADRFTEPELTCVNPVTGKSDGFGDLKTTDERGEKSGHAMLFRISIGLART